MHAHNPARGSQGPHGRRRWQFSVRALLLVTAALALWLGWLTDRAARQRRAVERFTALGADLFYDDRLFDSVIIVPYRDYDWRIGAKWAHHPELDSNGQVLPDGPYDVSAWEWLPRWVDKEYFRKLVAVNASGTKVTGEDLRKLRGVVWLKRLALDNAECIGDEDLAHVGCLRHLERLFLRGTKVGDAGLPHLSAFTDLRYLSLAGTRLTDEGVKHLQGLKKIEMLDICDTSVSDAGIAQLKTLKRLQILFVNGTRVTEKGAEALRADLPQCDVVLFWPGEVL